MKGSTIFSLIKDLSTQKWKDFLGSLLSFQNSNELKTAAAYFRNAEAYSETDITSSLSISKWSKNRILDQLAKALVIFLKKDDPVVNLELTYRIAHEQVFCRNYDIATDLLRIAFAQAEETENFQMVIDLWELVEAMSIKPELDVLSLEQAELLQENLKAYKNLFRGLDLIRNEPDVSMKKKRLEEVGEHPMLGSPENALSKRALYQYWKVKSTCFIYLADSRSAVAPQRELVEHIKEYPWTCLEREYGLAKEMKLLYQVLMRSDQELAAVEVGQNLQAMVFASQRANEEKAYQRFPFELAMALTKGDVIGGNLSFQAFLELIDNSKIQYASTFVTENLYWCAHFCIATKNTEATSKLFSRLQRFSKANFRLKHFVLTKFLEIIFAIESEDWTDATRLIKNLKSTHGDVIPKLHDVLLFLDRTMKALINNPELEDREILTSAPSDLVTVLTGQELLGYFDFLAWLESRKKACPMIEILYHWASPS